MTLRFERFRLDPQTGELWKDDRRVKLKPQPARVLALLANHQGSVVTREEIKEELWGDDTFVDYDLGINSCIRQIRIALGSQTLIDFHHPLQHTPPRFHGHGRVIDGHISGAE